MQKALAFFLLLFTVAAAHALGADPWQDWRTADSTHFRIHFRAEQRAVADKVAAIGERVYPRITAQLGWEPRGKTEIALLSEFDVTNGYSTPLPFNTIGIFLAPTDEGELLDNSPWLELLVTHEFTHIVHLDKVRGVPNVLQWIFGREPYFFPNAWQPGWAVEGIAVFNESTPGTGRGRLFGPTFEGWLRAERATGFISLREINANGRALPLSKEYLYGAYFYEYLERVYGKDAIFKVIHKYSGNIVPRLHTNPEVATGKTMDVLWNDFLADLAARVDERSAEMKKQPEVAGTPVAPVQWSVDGLAPGPNGAVYAIVNDGLVRPSLLRVAPDGTFTHLHGVNAGARLDARGDDTVLITQPEICGGRSLFFDIYLFTPKDGLRRITDCARLRRAVFAGNDFLALKNDAGVTSLVWVSRDGGTTRTVYAPGAETELVDLAATPDGKRVLVTQKAGSRWSMVELDATATDATPATRVVLDGPAFSPRYVGSAVQFVTARDGTYNVWQHDGGDRLTRLTHSYTGVIAHTPGTDGALTVATLAHGGNEIRRLATVLPLADQPAAGATPAAEAPAPADDKVLKDERGYLALRSLYPRGWLPATYADRGLTAFGASVFGSDALLFHQYVLTAMWETSQAEPMGAFEYGLYDRNFVAITRELKPIAWTGSKNNEETTRYERRTHGQWISLLPWLRVERRFTVGIGAAIDKTDSVLVDGPSSKVADSKLGAVYFDYDTRDDNWLSEGINRGYRLRALYETYKPFNSFYDGAVVRLDAEGYLPIGRSVLAARVINAQASGSTERFQLGGAMTFIPLLVPRLNERDLPLRGYRGSEAELRGRNARVGTLEFRTPIADVDRHAMVPPIGINRLSANVFFDIGSAWDSGSPSKYYKGVGAELMGEIKLLYLLSLQARAGVAYGLDKPGTTRVYAALGRQF